MEGLLKEMIQNVPSLHREYVLTEGLGEGQLISAQMTLIEEQACLESVIF